MEAGTYSILLELPRETRIEFGAAGERVLDAGWYAYTGSAFGPGGLSRVERHRRVARGENDTRHWHVDYLLGAAPSRWDGVWTTTRDAECMVAGQLPGEAIQGIGATDCDCASHLQYTPDRASMVQALDRRYGPQSKVSHSEGR